MAFTANGPGPVLSNDPGVRLVTIRTVKALLHMKSVLADRRFIGMTFADTGRCSRMYFPVRFVALMAEEA